MFYFVISDTSLKPENQCTESVNSYMFDYYDTFPNMTGGPFLESLGNLTGLKSYFEIKVSRIVDCVQTSNEVHFVSLADNFIVLFSKLLKLPSGMENKTA